MASPRYYKLKHEQRDIDIELDYGFRKRLTLTVYPNGRTIARIPWGLSLHKVENYLRQKTAWIIKHLEHFEQSIPLKTKSYIEGETFSYQGNTVKLHLEQGTNRIVVNKDIITFRVKDPHDHKSIARGMDRWYRREAIRLLTPRFNDIFNRFRDLDLPETRLRFYKMKRRWGSCASTRVITLNTELIKVDPLLAEYVIVHEICHLKIPAHNKEFYALLSKVMPDWKVRKKALNDYCLE